jgi:DNA polymerase alpha-associated DNA helicase A
MSRPIPISIPSFAQKQQQLILAEQNAEISSSALFNAGKISGSASMRRALQSTGQALTGLILAGLKTGLGGREVGEFSPDPATGSTLRVRGDSSRENGDWTGKDGGIARLPVHGIRVGDVVRVEDISFLNRAGTVGDKGTKSVAKRDRGTEGVVTRVGERSVWVAFGERGAGSLRSEQEDEGVADLWGKKLWM